MYQLSVGAMFKNESHCLREWIEHYLFHGVEHFYLIDDGSTDNFLKVIEPYLSKGLITLFHAKWDRYKQRQTDMYCHYIHPHLKETKWLLMVDLDEFMWSPYNIDLRKVLVLCEAHCQIQVEHTLFGSNGHEKQPTSLVAGFTRRTHDSPTKNPGMRKYFVSSKFPVLYLNIHQ